MKDVSIIVFETPEGIAMNLKDASYWHPDAVTFFGGSIEDSETPDHAIRREIGEEMSLDLEKLMILHQKTYHMTGKHYYLYTADLPDCKFEVYEGKGVYIVRPNANLDNINFEPKTKIMLLDYLESRKS